MINRRNALLLTAISAMTVPSLVNSEKAWAEEVSKLPRKKVDLVPAPNVHPHDQVAKDGPKVVEFRMVIQEKQITIDDDGTKVHAFTYDGDVPGPLMVVHQGDYVELTLVNPETNTLEHNIDFHASTGALGGGALTIVNPGEEVVLRFKADRAGAFVYHCAPGNVMTPWHVVSGMNGAILVLPRDGLKDGAGKSLQYDKIYYIAEQDFYIPKDEDGKYKTYDTPLESFPDMEAVMRTLTPTHVVFNGHASSMTGAKALPAKVGDRVLIIHAQANRDSRPHLIGGHGDYVWETGKFANPPLLDMETWFVRGGSASAALYTFKQPGIYAYVTHNLIEAAMLGGTAHFKVEGEWNNDLMKQVAAPRPITKTDKK
ncbi:copper-containing nitrite reductase [Microvirga sp. W0021]|uniref:Copper-containing nitrite reductase n=1 Tax=Hohaiivirga grylli TaxID=3133970 RepID=A0ABV0BKB9_9HYPH